MRFLLAPLGLSVGVLFASGCDDEATTTTSSSTSASTSTVGSSSSGDATTSSSSSGAGGCDAGGLALDWVKIGDGGSELGDLAMLDDELVVSVETTKPATLDSVALPTEGWLRIPLAGNGVTPVSKPGIALAFSTSWEFGDGVDRSTMGNVLLAGRGAAAGGGEKGFVGEFAADGSVLWSLPAAATGTVVLASTVHVQAIPGSDDAIVAFSLGGTGTFAFGGALLTVSHAAESIHVARVSPGGALVWDRSFPSTPAPNGDNYQYVREMRMAESNLLVVAAHLSGANTDLGDGFVVGDASSNALFALDVGAGKTAWASGEAYRVGLGGSGRIATSLLSSVNTFDLQGTDATEFKSGYLADVVARLDGNRVVVVGGESDPAKCGDPGIYASLFSVTGAPLGAIKLSDFPGALLLGSALGAPDATGARHLFVTGYVADVTNESHGFVASVKVPAP